MDISVSNLDFNTTREQLRAAFAAYGAVTTVTIASDFLKPLSMGDTLRFELTVLKAGNASVRLAYSGKKDGVEHLRITQTIAFVALDAGTATPIPTDLRPRIEEYLVA